MLIDTAAKLARAYWTAVGSPGKRIIVSRQLAYHGSNAYGTALGGMAAPRRVLLCQLVPRGASPGALGNDADALAK